MNIIYCVSFLMRMFSCSQEESMWADALRIAKEYAPHKLEQLQNEYDREANRDDR